MFSIRATRRSGDGVDHHRRHRGERISLLALDPDDNLEPGHYYAELGFIPPDR